MDNIRFELSPIELRSFSRRLRLVFSANNEPQEGGPLRPWEQITVNVHEGYTRYYYDVRAYDYEKNGTPSHSYRAYSSAKDIDLEKAARFLAHNPESEDWE